MEIYILFAWIIGTAVNAMVASEKGRSVGGVLAASIVCSPLAVYAYLLAVPALPLGAPLKKNIPPVGAGFDGNV